MTEGKLPVAPGPRVLVIGAGAAGLTAAFAAGWRGATVQLLDPLGPGGQLQNAGVIDTVPGLVPTAGPDLVEEMVRRFEGLQVETIFGRATSLRRATNGFDVATDTNATLSADVVIVATGSTPHPLGVVGEVEFEHRGVSHCAACDGPLYRGRPVVVAGGGDGAADAALALHGAGALVTLAHRGRTLRAAAELRRRVEALSDLTVLPATEVVEIRGDRTVTDVVLRTAGEPADRTLPTSAVFTAAGIDIDPGPLAESLERDEHGRLFVDANLACSTPGVFAAGTVRHGASDQLVGAMGDGVNAAVNALRWWNGELVLAEVTRESAPRSNGRGAFTNYTEYYDAVVAAGLGDGLPVVPPTAQRIDRFLAAVQLDASEVLPEGDLVARDVAACAVIAGCQPDHASIVFAAARSLLADLETRRSLLPDALLAVVVNGPIRLQADLNCSDGILGPGWRANASIGRAVRLLATGPLGVTPASGFGDPGQYTLCFGEDEEKSEWPPLHVERGLGADSSAVTVFPAATSRQVMDRANNDSAGIVDFLTLFLRGRASGTRLFGDQSLSLMVVIGQELRRLLAPDYTKEALRNVLFERATADDGTPFGPVHLARPDDVLIVSAGGVAFPTAWVFSAPTPPPITVSTDQTLMRGAV